MGSSSSKATQKSTEFLPVEYCNTRQRENDTVAADLDGTLLRSSSSYPYFMLVALEAGSLFRAFLLGLAATSIWFLYHFVSESAAIKTLIFISFRGLKVTEIEDVARAVLPKFYAEDVHSGAYKVFSACGKRYVVTANPRIMVEYFCTQVLGAHKVIGSEIQVDNKGRATGFLKPPGVLVGLNKKLALEREFVEEALPNIGLGDRETDFPFMSLCEEAYIVSKKHVEPYSKKALARPVIFHDGRLVHKPTPLNGLLTFLWLPLGLTLGLTRILLTFKLPVKYIVFAYKLLGVRLVVKGKVPRADDKGLVFACNHKTLLDPIEVAISARRVLTGLTYSVSPVSTFLSPIPTVSLGRNRDADRATMERLLESGRDICLCPEGTTCRQPYLLRFSGLFTEVADRIIPVAVNTKQDVFYGNTVRGWKHLDSLFFFMNPFPTYEVEFLEEVKGFKGSEVKGDKYEVANRIQRMIAEKLGYECTMFSRDDKYMVINRTDGSVKKRGGKRPRRTIWTVLMGLFKKVD